MPARSYQELRSQMSPQRRAQVDQPQPQHMVELLLEELDREAGEHEPAPDHARREDVQEG